MAPDRSSVPLAVVCEMGHGAVQRLAEELDVDLLHLKGAALDPALSWPSRTFSDVDVLVRPAHLARWMPALTARGWRVETSFDAGSPFAHAATMIHPTWGYLDVHRCWPGFDLPPDTAFDELWSNRSRTRLAGVPCMVPQLADQALIQCLNLARSGRSDLHEHAALRACWDADGGALRGRMERRVIELHAQVAYSVLDGTLDAHAGHPDHPLWVAIARDRGQVAEWVARVRRERTLAGAARVVLRAPLVNVEHLRAERGRPVTRSEVIVAFFARLRRAARELRP